MVWHGWLFIENTAAWTTMIDDLNGWTWVGIFDVDRKSCAENAPCCTAQKEEVSARGLAWPDET